MFGGMKVLDGYIYQSTQGQSVFTFCSVRKCYGNFEQMRYEKLM
jgi:hypothetical protein